MDRRWTVAAFAALSALTATAARADVFKDEELGYSILVPQGWRQIPIAGEEQFIVSKFQCDREYTDKKEGRTFRPELKVILFDPKAKKTAEVKEGDGVTRITVKNPYKDFKDYVKSDGEGGRYISKEDEIKVGDVATTWYEVAYEKLTVPRHGIAYVYHAEDIDYCATMEVLEDNWAKLSPMLTTTLKSFKVFPRKGSVKRETTGDSDVTVLSDLSKLSPEERAKLKTEKFERDVKIATSRLPAGWTVKRTKNFVAFIHGEDKYAARTLDEAEGVRAWLDANFAWFGDGTPGPEIIRVCKDYDEERAFRDTSARSAWTNEIVVSPDDRSIGFGWLADSVFSRWRRDKNPNLSLPPWFGQGLSSWMACAYLKSGKLEFKNDLDTNAALKVAVKQKKLIMPRDFLLMTYDELFEREQKERDAAMGDSPTAGFGAPTASPYAQAGGLVRYLLAGPGKANAKTKDLLHTYLNNLEAVTKEQSGKNGEVQAAPKTEQEEEEQYKNRESFWKAHEKELLQGALDKTFAGWTDADWASLDRSYTSFAG